MFDDPTAANAVFDFDELADQLLEQGLDNSPAELHGALVGLLAAGGVEEQEAGLAGLCRALALELFGDLAGQVMSLYKVTAAALLDEEFDFHPLLPDDDSADIATRTLALGSWCRGFLRGFATVSEGRGGSSDTLSAESREILEDFAAIAEADVDDEASEEESEGSYTELVEYIRFASLNIFMETIAGGSAPQ